MFIDGKRIQKAETFDVLNPYTKEITAKVPIASKEDILRAMQLSYNTKKNLTKEQRIEILTTAAKKIKEQRTEIAKLITSEAGLSMKDTLHEADRVYNSLNLASKAVEKIEEDTTSKYVTGSNENPKLKVISEPFDLVLGITPFNHPMNQVVHKLAPTVMSGSAIVVKPTEKTPLSAIKLAEVLFEAGLPANFINILTTDNPAQFLDDALSTRLAQMVTFTGGTKVGYHIKRRMIATGNELVKYVPELGGNSSFTILDDADLKLAAERGMNAFANSGQRCTSIKRILLHNGVADDFIAEYLKKIEKIKYGDPMDPSTDMGTVISEDAAKKIQGRVEAAVKEGAKVIYGNKREGALYSPTLIDNVNPKSELVVKETFGPVAPIIRINNIDEAIKIINSVCYKLAGGVMTSSREKAENIANAINVGQFNWNNNPGYRTEQAPFGGFGCSGNGEKEGVIMAAEGMRRIRTFYQH